MIEQNGPNTSEKASKMPVESLNFQTLNVQVLPIRDQKHDGPLKFTKISSTSHPDVTPSGTRSIIKHTN